MFSFFATWVRRTPLALPLIALLGVLSPLLGASAWLYALPVVALILSLMLKEWRFVLATLLISSFGFLHLDGTLRSEARSRDALFAQIDQSWRGVVFREVAHARLVKLDDSSACVELRGDDLIGSLGDRVEWRGIAKAIPDTCFPGCFDRAAWLRSKGVVAQMEVLEMQILPPTWNTSRIRAVSADCRRIITRIIMPDGTEGDARRQVLCALLLGERQLAGAETLQIFQESGTLHAFAVSGLHVGLLAGILWFIFSRLSVHPRLAQILILILLAGYVFLTGMAVASQRAYLMIFFYILGMLLRRQVFMPNLICFAALFILCLDPRQLSQAGFLLSFVVYIGIYIAMRACRGDRPWFGPDEYVPSLIYTRGERRLIKLEFALRSLLIIAMSACLVSLPLNIIFFSSYSSYSVLTNICITPLLPIVMLLGLLMVLTNGIPVLSTIFAYGAIQSSGLLLAICSFFAGLPSAFITTVPPSEAPDYALFALPYEQHVVVLGNPAVLIHSSNATTAQWTICPAVRGAGFQARLIIEPARSTATQASAYMQGFWKDARLFRCSDNTDIETYQMGENTFTIYPAPCLMLRPLADDKLPLIHWESPQGRLLYIGNASAATYYSWREQGVDLSAQTAVIGYNHKQPFLDEEELQSLGVTKTIKLQDLPQGSIYRSQIKR